MFLVFNGFIDINIYSDILDNIRANQLLHSVEI